MSARGFAALRVVTCDGAQGLGVIEDGAVVFDGARITYVGPRTGAPAGVPLEDVGDRVVTPGLVDAHTHACWAGSRHAEYAVRMAGGDYRDIQRAGGGILSTQHAVAAASEQELTSALVARLGRMRSLGVTTVEVKSGYGLTAEHERKQLAAIARAAQAPGVPAVVPTLLALHALPPGVDRAAYVDGVARELVPEVAREGLARFVDAYVDANAFTADEARRVGEAARAHGLGVRLHVGQFADVGGAELAASLAAASVDHLEHVSPAGIEALARAGVHAVLLPVASFTLKQEPPPIAALRAAGIPLVVASDANPGTAPTESLPLAIAGGVRAYGLTPDEAIAGATRAAAQSLGLDDRGVLRAGARADLVVWDLPHEHAIVQPWGVPKTHAVVIAGS
ncbi:MAG TPA: imidazolonepropionase [Polyangiaceae bacterium]